MFNFPFRPSNVFLHAAAALTLAGFGGTRANADASVEGHVQLPKSHAAPVLNQRYEIVTKAGVVSTDPPRAVVYLEGHFPVPETPLVVQMAQKNLAFSPPLLPVRVGTKVEFPNEDDVYHNIFSYSSAKRFDLGRYRSSDRPVPSQTFDQPGVVTLRCDIHEHMRGAILVLESPYFVISDGFGNYHLDHLPAGSYVLKAWIDSKTTLQKPVQLIDGQTLHLDLQ
ncbi:MAG TPA: carboxypeptidase regulatory-like domain-containing protein [Opitutaceae bacterium]